MMTRSVFDVVFVLPVVLGGLFLGACDGQDTSSSQSRSSRSVDRRVEASLRDHVQGLQDDMPREGTEGFAVPTDDDLANWRMVVGRLVDGDTSGARSLISEHASSYELVELRDPATEQSYVLLQEGPSVARGWGAVVLNPNADRNVFIEVPHPVFDLETHVQGAELFRDIDARALIMAGTHRCANEGSSHCDGRTGVCGASGPFKESDAAHVEASPFQMTHEVLTDRFPAAVVFSLHGNGRKPCETVFLSSGVEDDTPPSVATLHRALEERGVSAGTPETSSCPLIGSTNVQGRHTNGSSNPCTEAASTASGRFIHVEQKLDFRRSKDKYQHLIEAIKETL
jgi:hypothetical protein